MRSPRVTRSSSSPSANGRGATMATVVATDATREQHEEQSAVDGSPSAVPTVGSSDAGSGVVTPVATELPPEFMLVDGLQPTRVVGGGVDVAASSGTLSTLSTLEEAKSKPKRRRGGATVHTMGDRPDGGSTRCLLYLLLLAGRGAVAEDQPDTRPCTYLDVNWGPSSAPLRDFELGDCTSLDLSYANDRERREGPDAQIGDKGVQAIAAALKENCVLTKLDLSKNSIGDEGAQVLAEVLWENSVLTELDLGSNSIGDEGAQALAEALKANSALTRVDLSLNWRISYQFSDAIDAVLAVLPDQRRHTYPSAARCTKNEETESFIDYTANTHAFYTAQPSVLAVLRQPLVSSRLFQAFAAAACAMVKSGARVESFGLTADSRFNGKTYTVDVLAAKLKLHDTAVYVKGGSGYKTCRTGHSDTKRRVIDMKYAIIACAEEVTRLPDSPPQKTTEPDVFSVPIPSTLLQPLSPSPPAKKALEKAAATKKGVAEKADDVEMGTPSRPPLPHRLVEPRTALVIGNAFNAGHDLYLPESAHDAENMASQLSTLHFGAHNGDSSLRALKEVDHDSMYEAVDTFIHQLKQRPGLALFYYSGHGVLINGNMYLVPADIPSATVRRVGVLEKHAFELSYLIGQLENLKPSSIGIVILDACRSPLGPQHKALAPPQGKLQLQARGMFLAYASKAGNVAHATSYESHSSGLSPFTYHLLNQLQKPRVPLSKLFADVTKNVMYDTREQQLPSSEQIGFYHTDIYLNPGLDQWPCPVAAFSRLGSVASGGDDPNRAERHCVNIFAAVLASEAAYEPESVQNFLDSTPRSLAAYLMPWHESTYTTYGVTPGPELQIFNLGWGDTVIVAFRGTDNLHKDLVSDLRFAPTEFAEGTLHTGFYERSREYPIAALTRLLKEGKRLLLTGHSLGGAIAQVLTLRLLHEQTLGAEHHGQLHCVTFGAPMVGNEKLAEWAERTRHGTYITNLVYRQDVVPRLLLFRHEASQQLVQQLDELGVFAWACQRAEQLAKWTLPANYQVAIDAFKVSWKALNYYWEQAGSAKWDYAPIGTTYFLEDDHVVFNSQSSKQIATFLKSIDADFGSLETLQQAVAHHSRKNYASALEGVLSTARGVKDEL